MFYVLRGLELMYFLPDVNSQNDESRTENMVHAGHHAVLLNDAFSTYLFNL